MGEKKKQQTRAKVRTIALEVRECGEGDAKKKSVRASVSSENPCPQWVFDEARSEGRGEWVKANEILGHTPEEIDMSRCANGLVVQDTHDGDQIGLIRNVEIADGKMGGEIEWCAGQRAQDIRSDAERGLRTNMSVGYMVEKWEKVADGEPMANGKRGLPTYRATRWTPYEASFVNVPADVRVGVGRELDVNEMAAETAVTKEEREIQMDKPVETPAVETSAIDMGAEVRALKDEVVQLREALKKPEMPAAKRAAQFDDAEKRAIDKNYSVLKVVRHLAGIGREDVGFERELSDEIGKRTGRQARGFFIPENILARAWSKGNSAGTGGKNLVATDTLFGDTIEALVAKTVLGTAGARTMTGLVGDISIPKGAAATSYFVTEGNAPSESTYNIGAVTGTPHTLGAYTDITRRMVIQSGIGAEAYVAGALRNAIQRGIDAAGLKGSGYSGQPTGVESTNGVNTVSMTEGAPTKANMVAFWKEIAMDNADGASMKFICSPVVKALLATTLDYTALTNGSGEQATIAAAVTAGKYLCQDDKVEGYDVLLSNLCTSTKLLFGDWSQLILAFWSGLDLTVDTNSLSASGGVRVVALQDMDVLVRHPEAFAIGTALSS